MPELSSRQQARLIDDWCEFFESGPTGIWDLAFDMRMPKRLFDALSAQTQLRSLGISWGVYDNLGALEGMTELIDLHLESATSVTDLAPLAALTKLEDLELGGTWRLDDYSIIGTLVGLRQLRIGGGHSNIRQHTRSLEFLTSLRALRRLDLMLIPDELDYSPLLELVWVEEMWVSAIEKIRKTMTPSMVDLEWALPGLQRAREDRKAGRTYEWYRGERIGDYRRDEDDQIYLYRYDLADTE
ncbi:hypothetical protein [Microbacterium sp. RU33B]|uniref:hypothetical protein n=1 Tax=Microbacterium sp. RU33B TaxID=1907390 RepID=UPI00117CD392|nr:hypothetical protein [Microbacterium sp. RU33B]